MEYHRTILENWSWINIRYGGTQASQGWTSKSLSLQVFNCLNNQLPHYDRRSQELLRNAGIGFCASAAWPSSTKHRKHVKTCRTESWPFHATFAIRLQYICHIVPRYATTLLQDLWNLALPCIAHRAHACSSALNMMYQVCSDTVSNSLRVLKTHRQTREQGSYLGIAQCLSWSYMMLSPLLLRWVEICCVETFRAAWRCAQ